MQTLVKNDVLQVQLDNDYPTLSYQYPLQYIILLQPHDFDSASEFVASSRVIEEMMSF